MIITLSKQASKQARNYWLIDYIKLVAAILVVAIHTSLTSGISNLLIRFIVEFLESLAVPFFFCTTGYLLQEKIQWQNRDDIIKQWIFKYVKLYIELSLVYFPLTLYGIYLQWNQGDSILKISARVVRNYFLVGEQFYSWPLWYLLAIIFGLVILLYLPKVQLWSWLFISILIFVVAYMINEFPIFHYVKVIIGNGRILTGASYLMLGMLVYQKREVFNKPIGLVIVLLLCIVSSFFHISYTTTSTVAYIAVPWIVGFGMYFCRENEHNCLSGICREISTFVYYSHMYFLFCWSYVLADAYKGIKCFLFVACVTAIFSLLICIWRRKRKCVK